MAFRHLFSRLRAKVLFQIACDIFELRIFTELVHFAIADILLDPHVATDPLEELDHLCRFFLREQVDLQIEVAAMISFFAHPVLADENEASEEDSLQRQYHGQEREWKRVEG